MNDEPSVPITAGDANGIYGPTGQSPQPPRPSQPLRPPQPTVHSTDQIPLTNPTQVQPIGTPPHGIPPQPIVMPPQPTGPLPDDTSPNSMAPQTNSPAQHTQVKRLLLAPRKLYGPTAIVALTTIIAILLAVIVFLSYALVSLMPETRIGVQTRLPVASRCYVSVGDVRHRITPEQGLNASIIVGESLRRQLAARAASIGLTTAWQESGLRNLDWGDLDSLGLFQQRPSAGWGTPEQIMDPWYSSGAFYDVLVTIPGWEEADITETAQEVQRSAYPDAYRKHESYARAWASALTGWNAGAVTCMTNAPSTGDAESLVAFFTRIYGAGLPIEVSGNTVNIIGPNEIDAWAIAQLAVVRSATGGVIGVSVRGRAWTNDEWEVAPWLPDPSINETGNANLVVITLQP